MSGTVEVPKVGPVKKGPLIAVGSAGAAYVLWRWYQARQAAAAAPADTSGAQNSSDFADPGALPTVDGAYTGQLVGIPDGTTAPTASDYGFSGTTNSQWTQYAAQQLSMSGTQDYNSLLVTLGQYLAGKPLTTAQQQTVQAAIAVAGYPPEGSHPIIGGGDAPITVAPTGLTGSAINGTSVRLSWTGVSGAAGYRIYRSGVTQPVGEATSTSGEVGGLSPGTSYSFTVAAHTASGQIGPKSGSVTVRTPSSAPKAPEKPILSNVQRTSLTVVWKAVAGATEYHVYRGGVQVGTTAGTWLAQSGLKPNTAYSYQVQAVSTGGGTSPKSASATARTKK